MTEPEILAELKIISQLLATQLCSGLKQRDAIVTLSRAGLSTNDVAGVVGTTPATVRAELAAHRKKGGKRKRG